MAEYIEKQKIKEQLQLESDCRMIITLQDIFDIIDFFPATDVVEVCRCRDCRYYENNYCGFWEEYPETEKNDFCSYGKRRESNE